MIYLDYSSTTPILGEVLDSYDKVSKEFIGNPHSLHKLGTKSNELMQNATKQIADLLEVKSNEIIYTSGATESNNLAIKGIALEHSPRGKHIITTKLEHPSIYAITDYLESIGYEITILKNDKDGLVDIDELKKTIRKDTILVSIAGVNSEMGIRQPLKTLNQIIKRENPNVIFHSDITQAIGKVAISLKDVDMASMSGHKIYGPKGIGILYKSENIVLTPVIHGSGKESELRPGTPSLPLIVAFSKALRIAMDDITKKEVTVKELNEYLVSNLEKYEDILINKTKYCINQILNFTFLNVRPETVIHALEEYEIYVGTNTACATGDISAGVLAVYNDRRRALSTIRISLSYITTKKEIECFLQAFDTVYNKIRNFYK